MDALGLSSILANALSFYRIIKTEYIAIHENSALAPPAGAEVHLITSGGTAKLQLGMDSGNYINFEWPGTSVDATAYGASNDTVVWLKWNA